MIVGKETGSPANVIQKHYGKLCIFHQVPILKKMFIHLECGLFAMLND